MSDLTRKPILSALCGMIGDGFKPASSGTLAALNQAIDATFARRGPAPATGAGHAASATPPPVTAPAALPQRDPAHRLGALSERYESGGRGPGAVSSGLRDPGGVSYGLYQLATRTGTAAAFVTAEGSRWAAEFAGCKPGTAGFTAAWQAIARREPEPFGTAQHAFIERTHYRPAVNGVKAQTGLDLDARADAVRDACWSVAVQHGAASRILCRAVGAADAGRSRGDVHYDRALVEAIYVARSDYVRKVAETCPPPARQTLLDVITRRYPAELARALAMLPG